MARNKFNTSNPLTVGEMNSLLHTGDVKNYKETWEPASVVSSKDTTIFESNGITVKNATTSGACTGNAATATTAAACTGNAATATTAAACTGNAASATKVNDRLSQTNAVEFYVGSKIVRIET